jgi:ketosteroid isomerase-like protein
MARSTEEVLQHHLDALAAQDIEAVLSDYADDASLVGPDVTVTGSVALHDFFTEILKAMPGITDALSIDRTEIVGEVGYIVWHAPGYTPLGTDTFVVRDGRIVTQTFAMHSE